MSTIWRIIAAGLMMSLISSCIERNMLGSAEEFSRDAEGKITGIKDNEYRWMSFRRGVANDIKFESSGRPSPSSNGDWLSYWHDIIDRLISRQENHAKYVEYIIAERKRNLLPDLSYIP